MCSLNYKNLIEQNQGYLELFWSFIPDFLFLYEFIQYRKSVALF